MPAFSGPINVIVDTDMYTDVDDVGALAVTNALMSNGEANLVGVVVDTSSQYSAGCAAAIDTYFGHSNVPIGITYPVTTAHAATPDYVFPCSQFPQNLNYASILTALSVYLADAGRAAWMEAS